MTSLGLNWMNPIIEFVAKDVLSNETKEVEKIQRVAARF